MMWLWSIAGLTVFIAWYTSPIGREWLKGKWWAQWYYGSAFAERVEIVLFNKSDTILLARFKMFLAAAWQFVLQIGAIDPTPFLIIIPEKYHTLALAAPSMVLALDGIIGEIQRRWTTKPLAVVAVPEATPVPAAVADAMQEAETAKDKVVEAVAEAKAEGTV